MALLLRGRDLATNGVWNFCHGHKWNAVRGNAASAADLEAGRCANGVVGGLAVAVVYRLGARPGHWVGGTVARLLLAPRPLMVLLGSQALADGLLSLLLSLAALAAARPGGRPGQGPALGLGAALGLGGATKLSPLLLSLSLAGLGVALLRRAARAGRRVGAASWPNDPLD